jgi:hypothetical protein
MNGREYLTMAAAQNRIRELEAAVVKLRQFAFVKVLNGGTGFHYLRCAECSGTNESDSSHEFILFDVKHEPACKVAAAIAALESE